MERGEFRVCLASNPALRSRWQQGFLHGPHTGIEKGATWLERFYDLIFVASFIQLGNGLSDHVSMHGVLSLALHPTRLAESSPASQLPLGGA